MLPDVVRIALAMFTCYRLAQLVALDDGPWSVFARLRAVRSLELKKLVECPYCLGVWFAIVAAILVAIKHPVSDIALTILGIAGAQAFLQGITDRREE